MPTYTANIRLQDALEQDYVLLNRELKQRSFRLFSIIHEEPDRPETLYFRRENTFIHEVASDLVIAAKKTGKPFSFTIEKEKEN
ncbi:hypothetical protein [Gynurincola endophyticus]|jgi:hypothetical protein|uniref:hypothetical protein n=1 Tax=Gynurincola endophyticus TaxID=2479004 RepID=UPI000F8E4CA6|nr:hypothetical protein [Gynurincola endophyticus]